MVENIFRHLAEPPGKRFARSPIVHSSRSSMELHGKFLVIANSAIQVNRSIFFSAAIIIAGFVPLFTLSGVEGHIFGPMATTYAYALAGGLIATFTISPALSAILLADRMNETETLVVRWLHWIYRPVFRFALANKVLTLGGMLLLGFLALVAARSLGLEFLPKLEEGNLWIRATMPTAVSLEASDDAVNGMRKVIRSFPEVGTAVSQHGRPDDGTDASGFFNAEFFVPLKPLDAWPKGVNKDSLTRALSRWR
jgi:cobalt-zinc-cadmium resistance protein CzcA